MFATTADRVETNTAPEISERIRERTEASIWYYSRHPELIPRRLDELDREWDVERCLGTGSSSLSLLGLAFGLTRSRKWLLLTLAVQGFFLQHAIQGWCPPLPLLRKLGVRTMREIDAERCALFDLQERDERREDGESVPEPDEIAASDVS